MGHKRKESLRIDLPLGLHDQIIADFESAMNLHLESPEGEGWWGAKIRYQKSQLLSKFVGPDTDPASDRKARAIDKWLATEDRNERTNLRLYSSDINLGYASVDNLVNFARRVILKAIGSEPQLWLLNGSYSGGASTRHKREVGVVARKFTGQADVTREAWPFVLPIIVGCYGWASLNPQVMNPRFVEGNVMFTVPKSTSIDRVACKEPDLNMFAQKAVGDYFRHCLKRSGIDLNDQSINQDLARRGSRGYGGRDALATLDLSSASDSVSTSLVARLLPPGWFVLLDALRCKRTVIGDEVHENHMFSSMGNGFTFELESLIFWALARAVAFYSRQRGTISIYGDDIIVPAAMAVRLARTFAFFGFKVNTTKSFWTGPFRESCGFHGWHGHDITPIYVKEPISNQERLIHFLNRLRRWAKDDWPRAGECNSHYWELWLKYSKLVDSRFYGGDNVADPSRLVTKHKPRFALVRKSSKLEKTEQELQLGLYLQALSALSRRGFVVEQLELYQRPLPFLDLQVREAVRWAKVASFPSAIKLVREHNTWVARRVSRTKLWASPMWWEESPHYIP